MNNTIHRFLGLLDHKNSGGIIEVVTFHGNRPQLAGYFNDVDRAASEIERFNGRENVYVSLNPVKHDLLARANNRLVQCKNRVTDNDVLCDSWFFIDIDPDRASGISSTEAELDLALALQERVYNWLI